VVTFEEGDALAREFKIPFYETSAMNDINVDEAFMKITRDVHTKAQAGNNLSVLKSSTVKPLTNQNVDMGSKPPARRWCTII
jgi:GTPase SAR1 family protein